MLPVEILHSVRSVEAARGLAELSRARDSWLAQAAELLSARDGVREAWVAGSLGRGDEDAWSDVDLVVIADDGLLGTLLASPEELRGYGDLLLPSRTGWVARPVSGCTFCSCTYDAGGYPLWVDWHVHGGSSAERPTDVRVVLGPSEVPEAHADFSEVLGRRGLTGPTVDPTPDESDKVETGLALVPLAAKWLARGAPSIASMLDLIGTPASPSPAWSDELATLRSYVADHQGAVSGQVVRAISRALDLAACSREQLGPG